MVVDVADMEVGFGTMVVVVVIVEVVGEGV